jgi:hypothetical protein
LQTASHLTLQQTPSGAHALLLHSSSALQLSPFASLPPHFPPTHFTPAKQSAALVHVFRQPVPLHA